jgi:hypothetical protein
LLALPTTKAMNNDRDPRFSGLLRSVSFLSLSFGGALLIVILGFAAHQIFKYVTRDRSTASVIFNNLSDPNVRTTKVGLGTFEIVEGTPYRIAPVTIEQEVDRGYYSKGAVSPTNYLVLNVKDKSAIRLVPKNNSLFIQTQKIGTNDKEGKLVKTSGIWYTVVKADTNDDKRLSEADLKTIAVSDVSGANYTEVIPKADRLLNTFQLSETNVLMIYETDGKSFVTELDLSQRAAIETKELPVLN